MKQSTILQISLLLILFALSSLYSQEVEMGLSLDLHTGIWTSGTIDEGLTFSSTYSVAYYQRIWKDAFKLGLGMAIWIPRWPYDTDWEVGFSDYAGYGTTLLYPFRFSETRNETISNFYLKGNVGYHLPIIWGYWADYKPGRVWLAES